MTSSTPDPQAERRAPTSGPVLRRALTWGALAAGVLLVVGVLVGLLLDGARGALSSAIGVGLAFVFLGLTALSILIANRYVRSDLYVPIFFGVVMGTWIVKFVVFIVISLALRDAPWVNAPVFFLSLIAGVLASLVVDVLVVTRTRMPYASDARLPGPGPDGV